MRANANPQPVARATGAIVCVAAAQLLATSLWFSANGAGAGLMQAWQASSADIGLLTNAVQLGFIAGTLILALSGLADRFSASRIFVCCALLGALCNAAFAWLAQGIISGAMLRALVGLCLAGVYPLGMKLIVSWSPARAGASLALLVGMLTLGTALPHALRALGGDWSWQIVISASSVLAVIAAGLIFRLGDGPHAAAARAKTRVNLQDLRSALRHPVVRAAFLGYLGHMWELYAFWTLVPMLLVSTAWASHDPLSVAALAFAIIAIGALGCLVGGCFSQKVGSAQVAAAALAVSALCCLLFPWMASAAPLALLAFMLVWGAAVVADSPQFSAMVAQHCPAQALGSTLALQNALGFALSALAISASTLWLDHLQHDISWLLLPGPLLGLLALAPLRQGKPSPPTPLPQAGERSS